MIDEVAVVIEVDSRVYMGVIRKAMYIDTKARSHGRWELPCFLDIRVEEDEFCVVVCVLHVVHL